MPAHSNSFRTGDFGSNNSLAISADPIVAFTSNIIKAKCPLITLEIQGKKLKIIVDTGTNVSISMAQC